MLVEGSAIVASLKQGETMSGHCEVQSVFETMSTLFQAWHIGELGQDGDLTLRRLLRNWQAWECEEPCPNRLACPFATSSSTVEYYGWSSYHELFAACIEPEAEGELLTVRERPGVDILNLRHLRQPGHFCG